MLIVRRVACAVLVASVVACGSATGREVAVRPTSAAGLQFVGAPVAILHSNGYVEVWVRLSRQLRHTVGTPGDYAGHEASIEVQDTSVDWPGLFGYAFWPTCYSQDLRASESFARLPAGTPVQVSLVLDKTHRVTGTAALQLYDERRTPRGEAQLGCPSKAPGKPRPRRCSDKIIVPRLALSAVSAAGTTCRRARDVLIEVGRHASGRCYRDLCVHKHPINLGYRCTAGLSGEATWDVVCRRGHAEIRGFSAE
jgi:hypothetical protein